MTEWRLWEGDEPPFFTTPAFFQAHPWISPVHQIGHAERMQMVVESITRLDGENFIESICDLGCGDGSLLRDVRNVTSIQRLWGITHSLQDIAVAWSHDLNAVHGNFLTDEFEWADITVMTEVLEHLVDPHSFLKRVESQYLVASSPSAETSDWHYEHHAWAWDLNGYEDLVTNAGWRVLWQDECSSAQSYNHGTELSQPLRFQVVVCVRP